MCGFIWENEATLLEGIWWQENKNKLVECLLIPWGLRVPSWKINFCCRVLRLSELPRCRGKAANCHILFKMIRKIKVSSDWFGCVLVVSFYVEKVFSESVASRLPVSPTYNLLQSVQVIQWMTLAEVRVKWSVILMDLLGHDISSTLWIKGQVLHRERAHLKVPGWLLVWNELVTKKLPVVLSRLNEVSGDCEKIVLRCYIPKLPWK